VAAGGGGTRAAVAGSTALPCNVTALEATSTEESDKPPVRGNVVGIEDDDESIEGDAAVAEVTRFPGYVKRLADDRSG
jgi:hypothetical protein